MYEVIFLSVLAVLWLAFASIQDLRKRMVANWISFSLIIFVLGFRFFYSLFNEIGFGFFYQGLFGLGIFFLLGNLFYYGRMFAGGDAKILIALGPILAFSTDFFINLKIYLLFLLMFLFVGAFYGIGWNVFLSLKNPKQVKKELKKHFNNSKKIIYLSTIISIAFLVLGFYELFYIYFGIFIFFMPYLYFYVKAVDESCLIKNIKVKNLEEGDWLYDDLKIGKNTIKKSWQGLSEGDIKKIRKKLKSVKIREGIPFVPVFLISFLLLSYVWFFYFEMIVDFFGLL